MNCTTREYFHLLAFSISKKDQTFLSVGLLLIYSLAVLGNMMIIVLVCLVSQLHTPMYFFLCNLAFQDIIFVSAILPKLMAITITGDTRISFPSCLTQMFLFAFCTDTDFFLLATMAYDRYVAICVPLRYYLIMKPKLCVLLVIMSWILYASNAVCFSLLLSNLSFYNSHDLNHFFCDINILMEISCSDTSFIKQLILLEIPLIGIFPLMLILTSYVYIIATIKKMRTFAARLKTFSSCSSHLTVVLLFCGTSIGIYIKPDSQNFQEQDKILSLLYIGLVPLLNPLVYSLRNRQVWSATRIVFGKYILGTSLSHFSSSLHSRSWVS
ncbi:olfactory receptor 1-like [Xenopus laevis]|uniref:Olfactory receptor n=1 Tax=Xenopus laevis TaxID=8355 RepID=A0A8J0UGH1_XENLA|nr:olfactory receptor 1-like [Xenopus laevis]